jgi:curved DNA-binding protein CbpA
MIKFKIKKKFCENINTNLEKYFLKLDYYSILNVNHNATEIDIKKSYLYLAKKFHPDKYKGHPEIFKKICEAYHTLKDSHKREDYDKRMRYKIKKKHKQKATAQEESKQTVQEF